EFALVHGLIEKLKLYVSKELESSPGKKKLKYAELKDLISLSHQIESSLKVNIKQLKLIHRAGKDPLKFNKHQDELKQLLKDEGKILGHEEVHIQHIKETEEKLPTFKWDYTLVGYGSLMNAAQVAGELCSVSEEVKRQYEHNPEKTIRERLIPVLVFGWKRLFNRKATVPKWTTKRNVKRKALAAMDISPSHRHYFNAVAIKVSKTELEQLYKREKDYKLAKLKNVKHFVTGENIPNCLCFKSPVAPQEGQEASTIEDDLKRKNIFLA
ncbi:unnamed protein product, partial [marine sediment metagenome]